MTEYEEGLYWVGFDVIKSVSKSCLTNRSFAPAEVMQMAVDAVEAAVKEYREEEDQADAGH